MKYKTAPPIRYRAELIRMARIQKSMTQTELAKRTKLSVGCINLMEVGRAPWMKALKKVADFLKIEWNELIISERKKAS